MHLSIASPSWSSVRARGTGRFPCWPPKGSCGVVAHAFSASWLRSSAVSVFITVTSDMSPTGDLLVTSIFLPWEEFALSLLTCSCELLRACRSPEAAHPKTLVSVFFRSEVFGCHPDGACACGRPCPQLLPVCLGEQMFDGWNWVRWAEAHTKTAATSLTNDVDRNWSSFQLANRAPPLSVTDSGIAPSARIVRNFGNRRSVTTRTKHLRRCQCIALTWNQCTGFTWEPHRSPP